MAACVIRAMPQSVCQKELLYLYIVFLNLWQRRHIAVVHLVKLVNTRPTVSIKLHWAMLRFCSVKISLGYKNFNVHLESRRRCLKLMLLNKLSTVSLNKIFTCHMATCNPRVSIGLPSNKNGELWPSQTGIPSTDKHQIWHIFNINNLHIQVMSCGKWLNRGTPRPRKIHRFHFSDWHAGRTGRHTWL